ncbi:hypothetical protein GCM10010304_38300 [Streptomyces roseoviolaceus]
MVFAVSTVTARLRPLARARAVALRRKPSSSMAASTRSRVDGRTLGWPLITRETVWYETPAAVATSLMLAGRLV